MLHRKTTRWLRCLSFPNEENRRELPKSREVEGSAHEILASQRSPVVPMLCLPAAPCTSPGLGMGSHSWFGFCFHARLSANACVLRLQLCFHQGSVCSLPCPKKRHENPSLLVYPLSLAWLKYGSNTSCSSICTSSSLLKFMVLFPGKRKAHLHIQISFP